MKSWLPPFGPPDMLSLSLKLCRLEQTLCTCNVSSIRNVKDNVAKAELTVKEIEASYDENLTALLLAELNHSRAKLL